MKNFLLCLLALITLSMIGCGEKSSDGILDEISGVWSIQGETGLFSIIYKDNKVSLLADDTAIPVTLGNIDNQNKTVNFNVVLEDGKPGIWTLRQVWDKDNKSFHLEFTFHDGTHASLSFVRKISTDDLNKIANAEARSNSASANTATAIAATTKESAPPETVTPAPATAIESSTAATQESNQHTAFTPSFDCTKASSYSEKAVCSDSLLGQLDGALSENYKYMLASDIGDGARSDLKSTQKKWFAKRNNCTSIECLANTYRKRVDEVCEYPVISGVHPNCTSSDDIK